MDNAITITLKGRTDWIFRLRAQASSRVGALGRLRREDLLLAFFQLLPDTGHFDYQSLRTTFTVTLSSSSNRWGPLHPN